MLQQKLTAFEKQYQVKCDKQAVVVMKAIAAHMIAFKQNDAPLYTTLKRILNEYDDLEMNHSVQGSFLDLLDAQIIKE